MSPFFFLVVAEGLNLMAKRAVERGLIQAAKIGRRRIQISHVQYADDTLFIIEGGNENAIAIRWILKNFELASEIAVNFDKSWAFGVNMERVEVAEMVDGLGCRIGDLSIPYLGLKVGARFGGTEG